MSPALLLSLLETNPAINHVFLEHPVALNEQQMLDHVKLQFPKVFLQRNG